MSATCERTRRNLSALLDGELARADDAVVSAHVEGCPECGDLRDRVAAVRTSLRLGEAEPVPDLTGAIMARVRPDAPRRRPSPLQTFGVAAAATALVFAGATLPWRSEPAATASAAEIVHEVRRAARNLGTYHAVFRMSEYGWHDRVGRRLFRAEVWFAAPEMFRLEVDDVTAYPGGGAWPENDVTLIASRTRVRVSEPSHCPPAALPGCTSATPEVRTLTSRAPFDGRVVVPTDIVLPLDTLAGASGFAVEAKTRFLGRDSYRLRLDVRRARPLVASLQQAGSWRQLHPLDDVTLWIERETWFPLGFDVRASRSPDRVSWAAAHGRAERPGALVLRVRAESFEEPARLPPALFAATEAGVVTSGAFRPRDFPRQWPRPAFVANLPAYRSGRTPEAGIRAYAAGTAWLRVTVQPVRTAMPSASLLSAEEIHLGGGRFAYYRPAGPDLRRRIDLFGRRFSVRLEGNLTRAEMVRAARSTPLAALRLPRAIRLGAGVTLRRVAPGDAAAVAPFARLPGHLPHGYHPSRPDAALLVMTPAASSLVLHYRSDEAEYDGIGLRITQTPARVLPPASGAATPVALGRGGRYFGERGELEWLSAGVYHSIRAPSFDLSTLLRIAQGMR